MLEEVSPFPKTNVSYLSPEDKCRGKHASDPVSLLPQEALMLQLKQLQVKTHFSRPSSGVHLLQVVTLRSEEEGSRFSICSSSEPGQRVERPAGMRQPPFNGGIRSAEGFLMSA